MPDYAPSPPVRLGGDLRLVEDGLDAGERVVLDPPAGLDDGMRIAPRAPGA